MRTKAAAAIVAVAASIGMLAGPGSAEVVPVVAATGTTYDIPARVLRIAVAPDGDRVYLATPDELLVRDAAGAPVTSVAVDNLTDVAVTATEVILLTRTQAFREVIRLDGETLTEQSRTLVDYGPSGQFQPDLVSRTHLTVSGSKLWWQEDEQQFFCGFMPNICDHQLVRFDLTSSKAMDVAYYVTAEDVIAGDEIIAASNATLQQIGPANYYPPHTSVVNSISDLASTPDGERLVVLGSGGGYEVARAGFAKTGVVYPESGSALDVAPNGMVAIGGASLSLYPAGGGPATSYTSLPIGTGVNALGVVPDQLRFSPDSSTIYAVLSPRGEHGVDGPRTLVVRDVAAPDLGPFDDIAAFTSRQYADALGRPASEGEHAAARQALASGQRPGEVIAPLIRAEAAADPSRAAIIRLYQAAFLRPPDRAGLEFWLRRYEGGTKLTDIAASFAGSSEFQRRYGSLSNADFVKLVFQNVFGRTVDPSGLAYWTGRLDAGRSRGVALAQWSESTEYVRKMAGLVDVTALYLVMLDRMPTAQEFADAKAALAGGTTLADGADGMLRSAAYAARIAGT